MKQVKFLFVLAHLCLWSMQIAYAYDFEIDGYRYTVITSSTAEFAGVSPDYEGEVIIPEYVIYSGRQLSVNTIGEMAFQSYKSSFLRIPKHITLIKNSAFYYAQIDSLHFENCDNYISLQNTINRGPSMYHSQLGAVYIGREINRTDYNSNAKGPFWCSTVKKIYIEKTCGLGPELFLDCNHLEKVIVKNGSYIRNIWVECFRNCSQLNYIQLKEGLTKISSLAFYQCTSLDSIYIPSTITSIESNAFSGATNIKKVVSASDDPVPIEETAFPGIVYLSSVLYVPTGTKSKYETTTGWKEFLNIKEDGQLSSFILTISGNAGGKIAYGGQVVSGGTGRISVSRNQSVTLTITPDEGYEIQSVTLNGNDVTNDLYDNTYTIAQIKENYDFVVTFAVSPMYVAIQYADGGCVKHQVEKGKTYNYLIAPADGWQIHSVSFNGNDVTAELSSKNVFTTPAITSNSTLNVTFEKGTSGIVGQAESRLRVTAHGNTISVQGAEKGEQIAVYSVDGKLVETASAAHGSATITLPENETYIVKGRQKTVKVRL